MIATLCAGILIGMGFGAVCGWYIRDARPTRLNGVCGRNFTHNGPCTGTPRLDCPPNREIRRG